MKRFEQYLQEDSGPKDRSTLLNYLAMSFVKLANADNFDNRAMSLLLGAAILAVAGDSKSETAARKLAQLALSKKDV